MPGEVLMALAQWAGQTVAAAAVTDVWEATRRKIARLLGRGDPKKTDVAERWLDETHQQLTAAQGTDLEPARAAAVRRWEGRFADFLDEDPGVEVDLRAVVGEIAAQLPAGMVSATDHSVAAGRDLNITASSGGTAAGVIHGNVTPPNPTPPGSGEPVAEPGTAWVLGPGSVVADRGGVAVGHLEYQRREVASQPIRLAPRPVFLAGREGLLAELDAQLATSDGQSGPQVVALYGLGGAGKTSVALEYAHRHLAEVGLAWQFPADDPSVIAAGFGELAAQLGARELLDARDPLASVHGVLAAYGAEWLLVFDNAPSRASVQPFMPAAGRGRVLITSRDQIWPPGQAVDVPVLDQQVAAAFLGNRTGDPDQQAAWDLAGELGGLPLALEQAAAYVQATGGSLSLAGYLASFRQRRPDLLGRGEPIGYPETVATTWRLAFDDLQDAAPGAAGLLRLLAFCAPEAIPLHLLLQPRPGLVERLGREVAPVLAPLLEDPLAAGDAIAALRRYSLVTPAGDGSVSVHRLVQAVTADQMPAELAGDWQQAAAALIEDAIPADSAAPETWPVCAALLPHAQVALADDSAGMERLAHYLGERGSYISALQLLQRAFDARERSLGPGSPETLPIRYGLARWTGEAGDAAGARDQYAALLPISERVLGPEHHATLVARANLASWTQLAGDAAAARDQYAELLPVLEQVLGPDHPDTLTARQELARLTGEAGDPAAARDLFAALLPVRERVSGPEHPRTLTARHNLAAWTGRAGDPAAARDLFAALLPVRVRVLGPEHPDTLAIRAWIGNRTGEAGDPAAARDQLAALLPLLERVSGPEHPDTLTVRANLARWTGEAGDPAAARDQLAALLSVRERVSGPEHPHTLTARHELARWAGRADGGPSTA